VNWGEITDVSPHHQHIYLVCYTKLLVLVVPLMSAFQLNVSNLPLELWVLKQNTHCHTG